MFVRNFPELGENFGSVYISGDGGLDVWKTLNWLDQLIIHKTVRKEIMN